jgi:hypothetical protein
MKRSLSGPSGAGQGGLSCVYSVSIISDFARNFDGRYPSFVGEPGCSKASDSLEYGPSRTPPDVRGSSVKELPKLGVEGSNPFRRSISPGWGELLAVPLVVVRFSV